MSKADAPDEHVRRRGARARSPGARARRNRSRVRSRWARNVAAVLLFIVLTAILAVSGVKLYDVLALPRDCENLNGKALERIREDYAVFERGFYNTDDSTHGYSVVVWGDNHSSRRTFGGLIAKINRENADNAAEWNGLRKKIARLKADKGQPSQAREKTIAELEQQADEVHKMHLLFAINSGDLAYDGDVTKYRLTLQVARKLSIPMVTAIGNHDIRNGREAYSKVFGPSTYSFAVGNAYYIILDNADEKRVNPDRTKWFKAELDKSLPYDYCFVDMHVPPFKGKKNRNAPMDYFLADRKNAREIKDLAARYHATFVLAGHIHTYDADEWLTGDAIPAGMSPVRAADRDTDFIVSGGAGARLWKVDDMKDPVMSRARYHYFEVLMGAREAVILPDGRKAMEQKTAFRRQDFNPAHADAWYTFEEVWVCAFAKVSNLYGWEMLILCPLLALLLLTFRGQV